APRPAPATPAAPPPLSARFGDVPRANFDDDDDDETVVARISRELLEDAGAQNTGDRGSGLGQVLRRAAGQGAAAGDAKSDALLESLFDEPATAKRSRDASVITSARE